MTTTEASTRVYSPEEMASAYGNSLYFWIEGIRERLDKLVAAEESEPGTPYRQQRIAAAWRWLFIDMDYLRKNIEHANDEGYPTEVLISSMASMHRYQVELNRKRATRALARTKKRHGAGCGGESLQRAGQVGLQVEPRAGVANDPADAP